MDNKEKTRPSEPEIRKQWISELVPLFFERGFKALTIDDIARHIGVSKATFYKQFSSRDDLFYSVITNTLDSIRSETEKVLFNKDLSFMDAYIQHKKLLLYWIENMSNIMLEDMQTHFPKLRKEILLFVEEQFDLAKDFFAKGIEEGNIRAVHPAILARQNLLFFSHLFQGNFLAENGLTLKQAFIDFTILSSYGQLNSRKFSPDAMRLLLKEELNSKKIQTKRKFGNIT